MEKKTALYHEHVEMGARVVPFAGFLMPLQYSSILEEHRAVRRAAGMFDLSHMGEFRVWGPDAVSQIDRLVTNDIRGLEAYQVRYTPMCFPEGGIVDDLLVYRFPDHLMLVVNASNIEKDLTWIRNNIDGDVQIEDRGDETALVAVQGPRAAGIVQDLAETGLEGVAYYHFTRANVAGISAIVSRTGYTGEDGFELYVSPEHAPHLWNKLLDRGEAEGLKPVGLGARDTLRLEAGYMLYGNDIDETTSPIEAGLGWTVKFRDQPFIGRDVLEEQKRLGVDRRMSALEMLDRSIPRAHCAIWKDAEQIGEITSGTFSPTFERGIALGYVRRDQNRTGNDIDIEVRGQRHPGRVVRKPMYRREEVAP
ncbi:MAG TPA: glycine cleavage system aminomethyltransferase GcvT [Chloroflexota bacterium]